MTVEIRRTLTTVQHTFVEGGKKVETPTLLVAANAHRDGSERNGW